MNNEQKIIIFDAIALWQSKQNNQTLKNFHEDIQIQSVEDRTINIDIVDTYRERRDVRDYQEPLESIDLSVNSNCHIKRSSDVDPWSYDMQKPSSQFTEVQYDKKIAGSAFGEPCHLCHDSGQVSCIHCQGYGYEFNDYDEQEDCDYCNGSGYLECDECSGYGYLEHGFVIRHSFLPSSQVLMQLDDDLQSKYSIYKVPITKHVKRLKFEASRTINGDMNLKDYSNLVSVKKDANTKPKVDQFVKSIHSNRRENHILADRFTKYVRQVLKIEYTYNNISHDMIIDKDTKEIFFDKTPANTANRLKITKSPTRDMVSKNKKIFSRVSLLALFLYCFSGILDFVRYGGLSDFTLYSLKPTLSYQIKPFIIGLVIYFLIHKKLRNILKEQNQFIVLIAAIVLGLTIGRFAIYLSSLFYF